MAIDDADRLVHEQGIYALWDAYAAFSDYLNLSIDDILKSDNPLISALGMLDKRFGKRRLISYDAREQPSLVKTLLACRCECEGVRNPSLQAPPDAVPGAS